MQCGGRGRFRGCPRVDRNTLVTSRFGPPQEKVATRLLKIAIEYERERLLARCASITTGPMVNSYNSFVHVGNITSNTEGLIAVHNSIGYLFFYAGLVGTGSSNAPVRYTRTPRAAGRLSPGLSKQKHH